MLLCECVRVYCFFTVLPVYVLSCAASGVIKNEYKFFWRFNGGGLNSPPPLGTPVHQRPASFLFLVLASSRFVIVVVARTGCRRWRPCRVIVETNVVQKMSAQHAPSHGSRLPCPQEGQLIMPVSHLRGFSRDSLRRLRFYNRQKKRRKPQMHRNQNVNCRDLPQDNRRLPPTKSIVGRTIGVARIFDLGGSCKFSWLTSFTLDISHSPWHSVQFFYVATRMRVQL